MHVLCNGNKFPSLNRHTVQWSLNCLWKSEYYFRFIIKRDILWKKFVYLINVIVKGKEFSSIFCDHYVCIIYFIVFNYDFLIWGYNVNRIVKIAFILVLETTWLIRFYNRLLAGSCRSCKKVKKDSPNNIWEKEPWK